MNAEDFNFSDKGVDEIYKKVILILYNTSKFYESVREKETGKNSNSKDLTDRWIMSRLNEAGMKINSYFEEHNTIKACNEIRGFVEDLSTWYVRVNRDRLEEDRSARETLRYALNELSKAIAPILPFSSEHVYHSLNGKKSSVHLELYPKFDKKKIDQNLILRMSKIRNIVSAGLRERDKEQIGLKWPLAQATIIGGDFKLKKDDEEIIMSQLNVKSLSYKEGHANQDIVVDLDTHITPKLEAEGYAREMTRQVQAFRKHLGLEKKDIIDLIIVADDKFKEVLEKESRFIKERTNSKTLKVVTTVKETFKKKTDFKIKDKKGEIVVIQNNH